ncbi:MAG: hypothetical protein KJ592_03245 [Nanoarchaeota archaeon]|nr:hypothetical protein [Nanoarchaeota archaeon]
MEKETTPTNINPNQPAKINPPISNKSFNSTMPIPKPKKPEYTYAGKEPISELLKKTFPKSLIPTKRIASIMGYIFLAVIILSLFQLPLGELLSGKTDIVISVGYPLPFLELNMLNTKEFPAQPKNIIIDIFIYLLLAYLIDVIISLILNNPYLKSKKEQKGIPKVFKNKKPTLIEKTTEKILQEQKNIKI